MKRISQTEHYKIYDMICQELIKMGYDENAEDTYIVAAAMTVAFCRDNDLVLEGITVDPAVNELSYLLTNPI